VPDARVSLRFEASGDGELAAVGSGDPTDVASFHVPTRTTWHGVAVAILRPTKMETNGNIKLTVSANGLTSAEIVVATSAEKEGPSLYL